MIDIKTYGEIKNGAFYPRDSKRYIHALKEAGDCNHVLLTIKGGNIRTIDQNAYAWVVCRAIAQRMNQDGWTFTSDDIYRKIEKQFCKEERINKKTGKTSEGWTPLKKQPTDRFHEIIEQVRVGHMEQFPDNYIKTPAEYYGITEQGYDLWKEGVITFAKAKTEHSIKLPRPEEA